MKILNEGINPYEAMELGAREENSLHPCYVPVCTVNLCGPCPNPIRYTAACL